MLRNIDDIKGLSVETADEVAGHVEDAYLEDDRWVVRYLVVRTGGWLKGRKVLLSPVSVKPSGWSDERLAVSLTRQQIDRSPDFDSAKPVSRQHETEFADYYGYPLYWNGPGMWGEGAYPYSMVPSFLIPDAAIEADRNLQDRYADAEPISHRREDPHLRSCREIHGYRIDASEGEVGRVCGLLVDDKSWAIRYLIAETGQRWSGRPVLVSSHLIRDVSWSDQTVTVDLTRQSIKDAPPYDPSQPFGFDRERELLMHHERTGHKAGVSL